MAAALVFATTSNFYVLAVAGILGIITPTGNEIGPFVAIEQAALTDTLAGPANSGASPATASVARLFGRYQAAGELARAGGALFAGWLVSQAERMEWDTVSALRSPVMVFAAASAVKLVLYCMLSSSIEAKIAPGGVSDKIVGTPDGAKSPGAEPLRLPQSAYSKLFGLKSPESKATVAKLSMLFSVDAFAGGLVMQTFLAYWFATRWAMPAAQLGALLLLVNAVAGISGMCSGYFVARFGAVRTMVFTHLPSNVLLMLVPAMPSKGAAVAMLVLKCTISQMDVPARQAYVATVVASDERSAAGGITNIARSVGLLFAPLLLGYLSSADPGSALFNAPFYVAGSLKIVYDLVLYRLFVAAGLDG